MAAYHVVWYDGSARTTAELLRACEERRVWVLHAPGTPPPDGLRDVGGSLPLRLALRDVPVDELLLLVAQQRAELGAERVLAEREVVPLLEWCRIRGDAAFSAKEAHTLVSTSLSLDAVMHVLDCLARCGFCRPCPPREAGSSERERRALCGYWAPARRDFEQRGRAWPGTIHPLRDPPGRSPPHPPLVSPVLAAHAQSESTAAAATRTSEMFAMPAPQYATGDADEDD